MSKFDPTVAIAGRVGTDPEVKEGRNGNYVTFRLVRDFLAMDGSVKGSKWYTVNVNNTNAVPANVAKGANVEVRGKQRVSPAREGGENYYTINVDGTQDLGSVRVGKNGQPVESFAIEGRIGRDPETLTSKAGREYVKFSLAHNYSVRTEGGEWEDFPVWYDIAYFGDELPSFVTKGALVSVRGVDEVRTYESVKYGDTREACSIRAFDLGVPDNSPALRVSTPVDAAAGDSFEAPF